MKLNPLIAIVLLVTSSMVCAKTRWFEIEMILFERPLDESIQEDFELPYKPIDTTKAKDLITSNLISNAQFACDEYQKHTQPDAFDEEVALDATPSLDESNGSDAQFDNEQTLVAGITTPCDNVNAAAIELDALPLVHDASVQSHTDFPYLLNQEQLKFHSVIKRLRRKGLTPIGHLGWRFPESSRRRATSYRIIAGENFSGKYHLNGERIQQQAVANTMQLNALYDQLLASDGAEIAYSPVEPAVSLDDNASVGDQPYSATSLPLETQQPDQQTITEEVWQVDGLFKVYIRNNYLTIETQLNLRNEDTFESKLSHYYFNQFKRVISNQVHYFDHPKLGMVIQIRRFNH